MKKFKLAVLFVLIVSIFTGCTANGINLPLLSPAEREMTLVDFSAIGKVDVISFDCNEEYIAFLYVDMPDVPEEINEDDGGIVGSEGEITENDSEATEVAVNDTHLGIYDIKRDKLVDTIVVDTLAYKLAFTDDNKVQLWINNEGKLTSELYDTKLDMIGSGSGEPISRYEAPKDIEGVDSARFVWSDSLFYNTNTSGYVMIIFPDESNNYYMRKVDESNPIFASYNKLVLERKRVQSDDNDKIILSVNDYETGKCVNTTTIDNLQNEFWLVSEALINEKYVVYIKLNNDYSTESICCWNYNLNSENTDLDYTILSEDTYDETVKRITNNIKENYNIDFVMTPECIVEDDEDIFDYKWKNNLTYPEYYLYLYDLEYFFSTMPKELYTQMLCKDIDDPVASFEKLYVYLVGNIEVEDVGAYANNKNGDLYIVYSCNGFSYSTFCHELMHNMEYRIWNYYKDFDDDWEALNPDDFEYNYDDYAGNFYDNDKYADYFMRDYSTKGLLEDRATTFEAMCEASLFNNEKWWEEHKPLKKKVALLSKAIMDSYPCAKEINGLKYCSNND